LDATVEAATPLEAFFIAVRAEIPASLGILAEMESLDGEYEGDTTFYCDTVSQLRKVGLVAEPEPGETS